jgi:hypothetical protein
MIHLRHVALTAWLMVVIFSSAIGTVHACHDMFGDISGFLQQYSCVISSDCDPLSVCEWDSCSNMCMTGYYSFCVGQEYCGVYPSCSGLYCAR